MVDLYSTSQTTYQGGIELKCPYCGKEMKLGSIDVYDTLSWSPYGESRRGLTKRSMAKNGILLAEIHHSSITSKESYFCSDCQKVILNTN